MTGIPMEHGLLLAGVLFTLGLIGVLVRRNLLFVLIALVFGISQATNLLVAQDSYGATFALADTVLRRLGVEAGSEHGVTRAGAFTTPWRTVRIAPSSMSLRPSGVALTPQGEQLAGYARRMLALNDEIKASGVAAPPSTRHSSTPSGR